MHEFAHLVSEIAHDVEPLMRDRSKLIMRFQPCIDCRIALNRAVEAQQICSFGVSTLSGFNSVVLPHACSPKFGAHVWE